MRSEIELMIRKKKKWMNVAPVYYLKHLLPWLIKPTNLQDKGNQAKAQVIKLRMIKR